MLLVLCKCYRDGLNWILNRLDFVALLAERERA